MRLVWIPFGALAATAMSCVLLSSPSALASGPGCEAARPAVVYRPGGTARVPARGALIPCRYDTGARALEPSLDFTRDGRILFQA
jgi:hypothetical protein